MVLTKGHPRIDIRILDQYPEFVEFHSPNRDIDTQVSTEIAPTQTETPEEILQKAHQNIRNELGAELLNRVKSSSPQFFEALVVDLMIAMGYGGSKIDAGKALGQTGDEGVDGIIKEDRLGLDVIYFAGKKMGRHSWPTRNPTFCWGTSWKAGQKRCLYNRDVSQKMQSTM